MSRPRHLLLLATFALVSSRPAAAESFKSATMLPISGGVDYVLTADLNGDGKLDLVFVPSPSPVPRSPQVLLGNGDGTFGAPQSVQMPSGNFGNFGRFAIGDVNNDGKPDLIVVANNGLQSNIAVLLGNGDGTFQPGIVSAGPTSNADFPFLFPQMGIADFNEDGAVDIVIADNANDTISLLLGDNHGHFTLRSTWQDGNNPTDIHVADLNGDGHMDFVARGQLAADAVVYLGKGDGTFQPPVTYTGPNFIGAVVLRDMNHDGHLDMVVSGFFNTVSILLGRGDGTFSNTSAGGSTYGGLGPAVVDVDDFNGDGILDIAVASHNGLGILLGQGNLAYQNVLQFPVSPFPYSPAFGDFNGDGHIDFAVATTAGIALVFGNGDGTLHSADTYDLGDHVSSVVSGDLNGDKIPDIAVGLSDAPPRILLGKGDGTFTITPDQGMPNNTFMGLTGVGDFNGDHIPDLLSAVGYGFVEFGMGDGTFSAPASLPNAGPSLAGALTADFNNDGIADIAFLSPPNVIFMTAKPDHTYSQSTATLPTSPSFLSGSMAFADLNNDGKLDAVVNNSGGGGVAIFLGNGDGTFVSGPVYTTTSSSSSSFALADLDGDGNIDIVLCSGNSSANPIIQTGFEIQVLYGHGDGTFQNPVAFPTPHSVATIAAGDLNMDGIADLVLSDGNVVTIMNGTSNRTFGPPRDYLAGDSPATPLIIDLNGDGGPDLIFANSETNGVNTATVLLNLGVTRGTLAATPSPAVYGQPVLLSASFVGTVASSGLPSGPVGFSFDNGVPTPSILQNGAASITDSQLAVGTHSIQASWVGDATFNAHKLSGQIAITKADTSLTLSASPAIAVIGQTAVVTAQAVPQYEGVPTGTVQCQSGSTPVSPVKLNSSAAATLAVDTSTLAVGAYSYTASYTGDANFNASASATTQLKVADFSIAVSPGALTVPSGSTATASVAASTSSGFNGSIDLSCTGLPTTAHCSFAPASLSLVNAASATSTLTVTTTSAAAIPPDGWHADKPLLPQLLERFAAILAVILLVWRTRALLSLRPAQAAGLVCLAVTGIFAGCGGGSSGGGGTPQPTSFNAQVLATVHRSSPATSRTATLTVTIQQ